MIVPGRPSNVLVDGVGLSNHRSPMKPKVRINIARFWAGATVDEIIKTVLPDLLPYFDFEVSDSPRVLLYGPYPGPIPRGDYVKVFIGCENLRPIMSECDWAFGVVDEGKFPHPRYMQLRWGDDRGLLQQEKDWSDILRAKTRFCAFIHSHESPYREAFFRALSAHKKIDSPGRRLNNMPSIDPVPGQPSWGAKIEFLRQCKFVIAFEHSAQAGYHTEKLTHAIEADCLPIYWGDPEIGRSFNVARFVNARDYLPSTLPLFPRLPYRPHSLRSRSQPTTAQRAARRINGSLTWLEQTAWAMRGFDALVQRVIDIDRDDELYLQHLREPFLIENRLPDRSGWVARWQEIFAQALS
jgi:alpha(1,3/1,4) fucosyltransferase